MSKQYQQWIAENVKEYADAYGKCAEVTQAMANAFPELKRAKGYYHCVIWGRRDHWWLTTSDGKIIDPTAIQFPTKGNCEYEEWVEGMPVQTGICMDCGEPVYNGDTFCSKQCELATMEYMRTGIL